MVKPSWVSVSIRKGKLASPRQHSPDPSQYFQDVVLTSANLPEGDKDAIIAGVMALGGLYSGALTKLVTHVVTNDMDNDKCTLVQERGLRCKIVLPHWFDDCLKLGKKISERPYMFPDPELLRTDNAAPVRINASAAVEGASTAKPTSPPSSSPPPSPSHMRKNLNVLMSRKLYLSKDLDISERTLKTIEDLVNHGGGILVLDLSEADIYVGQYREGADYVSASRADKFVANLSWLYNVINTNKWTNPQNRLLHYPVPRKGLPGFEGMKISISNYSGESRIYLENLIRYCGAEFTKTMKQDNTHLVTAHSKSEKCEAAQEWNINIINHLWVEESYAKCVTQSLTNPRYTHFPSRTNLGEVCGQTGLDMRAVERMFFPKPKDPVSAPVSPEKKTKPKPSPRKSVPASSAVTAGISSAIQPDIPTPIAEDQETEGEEESEVKAPSTAKKGRGRPSKATPKAAATPRLLSDEKENESPLAPSTGRASKNKALSNLHAQAGDIALYQKEMKRKGGVTHGGRRSSHLDEMSSPAPAPASAIRKGKRKSDEATYDVTAEGSDLSDGETQAAKPVKKARTSGGRAASELPAVRYRMMVTGDERWLGNAKKEDADKQKLRLLGVQLTQDPKDVDILVAPRILRTKKFVAALAGAPMVVHSSYLDSALKKNKLLEEPPTLEDKEYESRNGFVLSEALERAKVNDRKLLRGWSIFVTKDIPGGFDTYKEIITLNGGDAFLYAGRTGLTMPKRRLTDDPDSGAESQNQGADDEYDFVFLVSGTSDAEIKLWKAFKDTAQKQDLESRVVKTDWLLNAAMSQRIQWDEKWMLDGVANE